ncbi:SDR family NAD(P)-dependent oxidoreductase [Nocardioides campestrisoli]|uniref:SDR family NAD(P)-dependent oxidoreductase n=1 Tax=Nocardioides campestrisoli TaxID=2736757 RepID=UPI0015E77B53|nr:SDR family NAD(P)-dependent oxidoreductase [Nocardioides campestrisoli]
MSEPTSTASVPPLALVTGASSGIGLDLARQFAEHGFDLVVNAEDPALASAAQELRLGGAQVVEVQADLRRPDGVSQVWEAVRADGRPLAAAALNAGVGHGGRFVDTDLAHDLGIIQLNIVSTVQLAKLVLGEMVRAGEGRVLVTSSIASEMPGAFQATYNASKSFLQSFTEGLQEELTDTGVTLTLLMPGPTETEFFERADMEDTQVGRGRKDDPALVARQGYDALMAGEARVVGGRLVTRVQEAASKVLPDKVKAKMHRRMAEPDDA